MRTAPLLALVLILSAPAVADYTAIRDAGSGQEPDLWFVLDQVVPVAGGWGDTDALNMNAGGRRVLDRPDVPGDHFDQVWTGDIVTVTAVAAFWGGQSYPCDATWEGSASQSFVWSGSLAGADPIMTGVDIDNPFGTFDIGQPGLDGPHDFIMGDRRTGTVKAWSIESLNSPWGSGHQSDRMVTFDVSGLDVSRWESGSAPVAGDGKTLVRSADADGAAYIVAFDPGSDGDFQDMLFMVEEAHVPEPSTIALLVGGGLVWLYRRKIARG